MLERSDVRRSLFFFLQPSLKPLNSTLFRGAFPFLRRNEQELSYVLVSTLATNHAWLLLSVYEFLLHKIDRSRTLVIVRQQITAVKSVSDHFCGLLNLRTKSMHLAIGSNYKVVRVHV